MSVPISLFEKPELTQTRARPREAQKRTERRLNKCFTSWNTLPGYLNPYLAFIYLNDTMVILNKKPLSIHNEWAQPNSFPWCEIVLSTCNHWWPPNDKKHLHAFLIDPSSLRARKSLYASDRPSLETGNNVGATLEMLMPPTEAGSGMAVNKTQAAMARGAVMTVFVNEVTADGASIHHLSQSSDNDASHLYLQPSSGVGWQMAPPTRGGGHGVTGLTERADQRMTLKRAAMTTWFIFIPLNATANYKMRGEMTLQWKKMTNMFPQSEQYSSTARKDINSTIWRRNKNKKSWISKSQLLFKLLETSPV